MNYFPMQFSEKLIAFGVRRLRGGFEKKLLVA
jgi:hypothetical protein